jgi:ribonuclease HI
MSEVWTLPKIDQIVGPRGNWLEELLLAANDQTLNQIMMIIWRIWFVRNEITHDKPMPSIEGSRRFLCSYMNSLENVSKMSTQEIIKGKSPILVRPDQQRSAPAPVAAENAWVKPPLGHVKLTTDGSFVQQDGTAAAGMIIRRSDGTIVLSSCRSLRKCGSALEAELCAVMEGMSLALEWCQEPIIVETDSDTVVKMLCNKVKDLSPLGHLVAEAKELLSDRIVRISKVPRSHVSSGHLLASFGRLNDHTTVWLGSGPEAILDSLLRDCNSTLID